MSKNIIGALVSGLALKLEGPNTKLGIGSRPTKAKAEAKRADLERAKKHVEAVIAKKLGRAKTKADFRKIATAVGKLRTKHGI